MPHGGTIGRCTGQEAFVELPGFLMRLRPWRFLSRHGHDTFVHHSRSNYNSPASDPCVEQFAGCLVPFGMADQFSFGGRCRRRLFRPRKSVASLHGLNLDRRRREANLGAVHRRHESIAHVWQAGSVADFMAADSHKVDFPSLGPIGHHPDFRTIVALDCLKLAVGLQAGRRQMAVRENSAGAPEVGHGQQDVRGLGVRRVNEVDAAMWFPPLNAHVPNGLHVHDRQPRERIAPVPSYRLLRPIADAGPQLQGLCNAADSNAVEVHADPYSAGLRHDLYNSHSFASSPIIAVSVPGSSPAATNGCTSTTGNRSGSLSLASISHRRAPATSDSNSSLLARVTKPAAILSSSGVLVARVTT